VAADYTAPATDWYGLAVFPLWNMPATGDFQMHVERLNDCITLSPGVCVNNKIYTVATGPANDYTFTQSSAHWMAVALLPDTVDEKRCPRTRRATGIISSYSARLPVSVRRRSSSRISTTIGFQSVFSESRGRGSESGLLDPVDDGADIFPVPGEITVL